MYDPDWFRSYVDSWGSERPSQFAAAFAQTIPIRSGETRLIEVGCGSGIICIYSLIEKKARSTTLTDIVPFWLDTARENVSARIREGLISPDQVEFLPAAGFADLPYTLVARHDLIAFNPPQLPYAYADEETKRQIEADPIEKRFRNGGEFGLDVVEGFFQWYANLPTPKPDAVIMLSSFLGRKRIRKTIESAGLRFATDPIETDATLRKMFWEQAAVFAKSTDEAQDRSIRKIGDTWHKKLITLRLKNK